MSDIRSSSASSSSSSDSSNENRRSWINRLLARSNQGQNHGHAFSSKAALSISSSQYDFTRLNKYQVEFIVIVQYLFSSCVRTVLTTCRRTCYDKIGVHSNLYNELENVLIGFSHWTAPKNVLSSPRLEIMRRMALDFGASSLGVLAISRARELQSKLIKPVQMRRTSLTSHSSSSSSPSSPSSPSLPSTKEDDETRRSTWTIFASKNKQRMKRETDAALNILSLAKQMSLSMSTRFEFDQTVLWIESFAQLLESRHDGEVGDAAFETVSCVFERLASKSFESTIQSFSSECLARYHDALEKLLRLTVSKAGKNVKAWRCASCIFVCDYRSETWLDRIGLLIDPLCKKYDFYRQEQKCNIKTCDAIVSCLTRLVEEMLSRKRDDEDVDHVNNILISITSRLLMDKKKKSRTKKINSKKKTRRLHDRLIEPQFLDFLHGPLSDFVVLMAQYRFDTVMIHVVLPLLRHRSSRETHAISNQLYFGLRVMCRIFEHVASTTTWKPACRRDDDDNVLSRAVRFVFESV